MHQLASAMNVAFPSFPNEFHFGHNGNSIKALARTIERVGAQPLALRLLKPVLHLPREDEAQNPIVLNVESGWEQYCFTRHSRKVNLRIYSHES